MKFCVIRTRRRRAVFTFIACVCLEGIGAHITQKYSRSGAVLLSKAFVVRSGLITTQNERSLFGK